MLLWLSFKASGNPYRDIERHYLSIYTLIHLCSKKSANPSKFLCVLVFIWYILEARPCSWIQMERLVLGYVLHIDERMIFHYFLSQTYKWWCIAHKALLPRIKYVKFSCVVECGNRQTSVPTLLKVLWFCKKKSSLDFNCDNVNIICW